VGIELQCHLNASITDLLHVGSAKPTTDNYYPGRVNPDRREVEPAAITALARTDEPQTYQRRPREYTARRFARLGDLKVEVPSLETQAPFPEATAAVPRW
jgi:hypothetical protein